MKNKHYVGLSLLLAATAGANVGLGNWGMAWTSTLVFVFLQVLYTVLSLKRQL